MVASDTLPAVETPPGPSVRLLRLRRYTWWSLVPLVALIAVVTVLLVGTMRPVPVAVMLAVLLMVAAVAAIYPLHQMLRLEGHGAVVERSARVAVALCIASMVVALGLAALTGQVGPEWAPMSGVVAGTVAIMMPKGRRWTVIAVAVAVLAVVTLLLGPIRLVIISAGGVLLVGWTIWQTWWYYETGWQLDRARAQAGELAVANERLRFAAELHDIQGHHLQVIALKSELATRLASRGDAQAAVAHMREVQQLARDALTETRSLVGGYRKVSLATEIANATRVLAAADVDARPRIAATGEGLGDAERLLGLVVREATTNILRHASAHHARIELDLADGSVRLLVANDGAGATPADPASGNGLPALAERLVAAGGSLRWSRGGGDFTVTATVPVEAPA